MLAIIATGVGVPLGLWPEGTVLDAIGNYLGVLVDHSALVSPILLAIAIAVAFVIALSGAAVPAPWAIEGHIVKVR